MSEYENETGRNADHVLRTSRLVLRVPHEADAGAVARLANDRVIAENTARIPHPYTESHAAQWIRAVAGGRTGTVFLAFLAHEPATLIGAAGLETGAADSAPELGFWIGKPFRGRGLGTELARALVDHAFEALGTTRLTISCRVTNQASRAVIERCGFQWTGCGLVSSLGLGGAFPVDQFRLERATWKSLVSWGMNRAHMNNSAGHAAA